MIDQTEPPPGWTDSVFRRGECYTRTPFALPIKDAHARYAEESRPAVIEFAEQVAAWLSVDGDDWLSPADRAWFALPDPRPDSDKWTAEQILAAARGERTLP
jgi:hypothetical protein